MDKATLGLKSAGGDIPNFKKFGGSMPTGMPSGMPSGMPDMPGGMPDMPGGMPDYKKAAGGLPDFKKAAGGLTDFEKAKKAAKAPLIGGGDFAKAGFF
jgi:hypothetical protein